MKKRYNLRDLDCANCAAKMENAIRRIDGVRDASVSFLTQKLTLEADEGRLGDRRLNQGGTAYCYTPLAGRPGAFLLVPGQHIEP